MNISNYLEMQINHGWIYTALDEFQNLIFLRHKKESAICQMRFRGATYFLARNDLPCLLEFFSADSWGVLQISALMPTWYFDLKIPSPFLSQSLSLSLSLSLNYQTFLLLFSVVMFSQGLTDSGGSFDFYGGSTLVSLIDPSHFHPAWTTISITIIS